MTWDSAACRISCAGADEGIVGALIAAGNEAAETTGGDTTIELDCPGSDEIEGVREAFRLGEMGSDVDDADIVEFGTEFETSELAGVADNLISAPDSELNGLEMATGDGAGACAAESTIGALMTAGAEVAGAAGGDTTLELYSSELDEIEGASATATGGATGGNVEDVDAVKFGTEFETIDG